MEWKEWKIEFQRLMYEDDLKTEFIVILSDDYWLPYFRDLWVRQYSPKDAYSEYLDECRDSEQF